jgi:hypothetical protein
MTSVNTREQDARERKATAISRNLRRFGWDERVDEVALFDDGQRRLAAKAAGQRQPSAETWALVVEKLRRPLTAVPEDPFAGLPD